MLHLRSGPDPGKGGGGGDLDDKSPPILESKVLSGFDFLSFYFSQESRSPNICTKLSRSQNPGSAPDILLLVHPVVCGDAIIILLFML